MSPPRVGRPSPRAPTLHATRTRAFPCAHARPCADTRIWTPQVTQPCRRRLHARRRAGHGLHPAASAFPSSRLHLSCPSEPVGPREPRRGTCCLAATIPRHRRALPGRRSSGAFHRTSGDRAQKPYWGFPLHTSGHTSPGPQPISAILCGRPILAFDTLPPAPTLATPDLPGSRAAGHAIGHMGCSWAFSRLHGSPVSERIKMST
jgi:hypothetical protein